MEADVRRHRGSASRARVVCHRCHEKKIRCDLQRIGATCSACLDAAAICEFRPSHKGHHRKKADRDGRSSRNKIVNSSPTRQTVTRLPEITPNGGCYVRALLGHQSVLHAARNDDEEATAPRTQASDSFLPGALRSFLETYSEVLYTWCPVIDVDDSTMMAESLVLNHSLASVARMIKASSMPGLNLSREHYERARHLFYSERQGSALSLVKAALLLSHCNTNRSGSPTDSCFWWLGVAIRLAQDMRLHRAPRNTASAQNMKLQRRTWWTLFARERILALCQGRPCIIQEDECNLGPPQVGDFPDSRTREAHLFVGWVNLCRIMGDVSKHMSIARRTGLRIPTREIALSLISWMRSLPDDLQLPVQSTHSAPFVRDVHILYLPYLTTIALVYLNTTGQDVPEVSVAAVLAASCIARIAGDVLLRGATHALPEDSGWFMAIAITALMHVQPITSLATHAAADIRVLRATLDQLSAVWSSAKILAHGLDKILDDRQSTITAHDERNQRVNASSTGGSAALFTASAESMQDLCAEDGVQWTDFFPFATAQTSPLVDAILTECQDSYPESLPALDFGEHFDALWNELTVNQPDMMQDCWLDF